MNDPRVIRLDAADNVIVTAAAIAEGETLLVDSRPLTVAQPVPIGHKVAARPIAAGEKVVKYGAPIGSATQSIRAGQLVHTHNLRSDYLPE